MTTAPATSSRARTELHAFLSVLAHGALAGSFFELRERHEQHMRRRFYPAEHPDRAISAILRAGREHDIYIGAAPRARAGGGRAAIALLCALWVDADSAEAIERVRGFEPAPTIVIATGGGQHAYWLLERPIDPATGEHANRRLATHLAADPSCTDAARILRPPNTRNHRYQPPRPVRVLRLAASERYPLERVLATVPELPALAPTTASPGGARERSSTADPLLELEPALYVSALLGQRVGRDGKVSCPFHADEHPSLHVYPTPAQGWYCFSCRRGGSVYDLAAALLSVQPRGAGFLRLRSLLHERLLDGAP